MAKSQKIDKLLTPSWLSGLIALALGLALTVGVILAYSFNSSQVQRQLSGWQNTTSVALTLPGQTPPTVNNSLQNTWPLLGLWGVLGLITYFVVETIIKMVSDASHLRRELNYVHARRDVLLKTSFEYLILRLVAVALWLVFIELFFRRIVPYAISAADAATADLLSLSGILYALLSFTIIILSLHLHTVFLRLCLRRPRVFSNA